MFKMIKGHKKVTPLVGRAVHETKSLCFFFFNYQRPLSDIGLISDPFFLT